MKRILAALAVSAGLAAPAHAAFTIIGGSTQLTSSVAANDFQADLIAAGYTNFTQGGFSAATSGGSLAFFRVASESANYNSLWLDGLGPITSEADPAVPTYYGAFPTGEFVVASPVLGQTGLNVLLATMNFRVDVDNTGGSQNAHIGTGGFGIFWNPNDLSQVIFAFDDSGASPEDNHDDFLVRVAFVPEPATWALMILGFAGLGLARRRRLARA